MAPRKPDPEAARIALIVGGFRLPSHITLTSGKRVATAALIRVVGSAVLIDSHRLAAYAMPERPAPLDGRQARECCTRGGRNAHVAFEDHEFQALVERHLESLAGDDAIETYNGRYDRVQPDDAALVLVAGVLYIRAPKETLAMIDADLEASGLTPEQSTAADAAFESVEKTLEGEKG